jgi:hypothetical protein
MNRIISKFLIVFIYVLLGIAFLSAIYDLKWLSLLDKPLVKIIYGLYLGWLGFFSFRLTRGFIENDIISALFPIESIISITWGVIGYFESIPASTFFSTSPGATALLISLFIPYYYGNIHRSMYGGWKEKRIEEKNK